jgi:hypothetical protein
MAESLTVDLSHLPPCTHNMEDEACGYFLARWWGVTAARVTSKRVDVAYWDTPGKISTDDSK